MAETGSLPGEIVEQFGKVKEKMIFQMGMAGKTCCWCE
jgi:hypothetical protein